MVLLIAKAGRCRPLTVDACRSKMAQARKRVEDQQRHHSYCHQQVSGVEPGKAVENPVQEGALHKRLWFGGLPRWLQTPLSARVPAEAEGFCLLV